MFQQDPEKFRLLVYMPKLKEGDTTPDRRLGATVSSKVRRIAQVGAGIGFNPKTNRR